MVKNEIRKIKVALAGMGGYGMYYVQKLCSDPIQKRIEFIGIVDPYAEKSRMHGLVMERNIPVFPDMDSFYRVSEADLMVVSAPIHLHAPLCRTAMQNGSHVLCEKPTAATLQEAKEMANVARAENKKLFIGFQMSFMESVLQLKQDLIKGVFGKPLKFNSLVLWERGLDYYRRNDWAGKIRNSRGDLILDSVASNAASHYLHNGLFLLGKKLGQAASPLTIEAVCCRANPIETFDTCTMRIAVEGGISFNFIASHAIKGNIGPVFEIICEEAHIRYDERINPSFAARKGDRIIRQYRGMDYGSQSDEKITSILSWLEDAGMPEPPCQTETTFPFLACTNALFDYCSMQNFQPGMVCFDEDKNRYFVPMLYEKLVSCYDQGQLINEVWQEAGFTSCFVELQEYNGYMSHMRNMQGV